MEIKPKLTLFDTAVIVVSLIVGIGIFRTPAEVAAHTGNEFSFYLVWIIGGIICLIGGLTYAEIGSRKPYAGGFYKILSECYGPAFAFMINWLGVTITAGATYAAISLIGADYLSAMLNSNFFNSPPGKKVLASAFVIFVFFINISGIKTGSVVLNIFTILKLSVIILFALIGFFIQSDAAVTPVNNAFPGETFFSGISNGLVAALFSYNGYQLSINLASDVINPKKNLPRGIIIGTVSTVIIYLLLNISDIKFAGIDGLAHSQAIAYDIGKAVFGNVGGNLISFAIVISVLGFLNVSFLYMQRTFYAMASDKVFPKSFMHLNPKTQAQEVPLIFLTVITLFFIIFQGAFGKILNLIIFNDALTIAIVASTIFIMRRKDKDYAGFRAPLYPVLPAILILSLVYISVSSFIASPLQGILSIAFFVLGYPLYRVFVKMNS
jgi:APA family basic amino acid/polyamine antiporter